MTFLDAFRTSTKHGLLIPPLPHWKGSTFISFTRDLPLRLPPHKESRCRVGDNIWGLNFHRRWPTLQTCKILEIPLRKSLEKFLAKFTVCTSYLEVGILFVSSHESHLPRKPWSKHTFSNKLLMVRIIESSRITLLQENRPIPQKNGPNVGVVLPGPGTKKGGKIIKLEQLTNGPSNPMVFQ